ncbi:hypothetical protein V9T40_012563 [Parthenolecanium corni]|uniref:Uncharacterized protein n=1 Tax=Parthenolecanium corni TaxID=536013 RepID=A0AAN9T7G7_9HEMI
MADSGTQPQYGFEALRRHAIAHKLDMSMWVIRALALIFTFAYFIPIIGNPYNAYYRILLANAAVSALRLHQRLPNPSISKEFVIKLFAEDSCHYLLYSLIFLYVTPVSLVLLPVFLFCLVHFASSSLALLDLLGPNSWWGARIFISLVEFQTGNILRLIAFTEIFLMPFVIILLFMGRAGLFTPLIYFHFLTLRYSSRRNPHTRSMFRELRNGTEKFANSPSVPAVIRNVVLSAVEVIAKLAPQQQAEPQRSE